MDTQDRQLRPGAGQICATEIAIVADDLTGACDSGVAFVRVGLRVRVVLESLGGDFADVCHLEVRNGVLAFTTETRALPPQQAEERVAACAAALRAELPSAILFKKVDSAARGHFGVEIGAALRASGASLALVAPAFQEAGRTVVAGVLRVRDWSGQDTAISLRGLFSHEAASAIEVLPTGPEQELEQGIAQALARGTRILLCDATVHGDLERLASAALRVRQPILWAGSAGLAHALADGLPVASPVGAPDHASRHGRTLLFAGTTHPVTSLQLSCLGGQRGERDRLIHRVPCDGASEKNIVAAFAERPVAGLILTGGDTAAFVLHALGASSIVLEGEVSRGIPWGFVEGGIADGCTVVTKSGGFGHREALVDAFEFCERIAYEPA